MESGSVIGRNWLAVIPYFSHCAFPTSRSLRNSIDALVDASWPTRRRCGDSAETRRFTVTTRLAIGGGQLHDGVPHQEVRDIAHALDFLDARIEIEPHTSERRPRNDIRLVGSGGRGRTCIIYDLKDYSLMSQNGHSRQRGFGGNVHLQPCCCAK